MQTRQWRITRITKCDVDGPDIDEPKTASMVTDGPTMDVERNSYKKKYM